MFRKSSLVFFLVIISVIAIGCTKKINFTTDGPFIILKSVSGGENYYVEFYPKYIAVYGDGTARIYTEGGGEIIVGEDAPVREVQLTDDEIEEIKETIEENQFLKLDTDISDQRVLDGSSHYITVYTENESKEVGGYSPDDDNFDAIYSKVKGLVRDEYNEWLDDIDTYIYEVNPGPSD